MSTQFVILLIFAGISTLSWVFGKLREQAELKRARDEARRRRDEELRTGRAVETPAPGTRQSAAQSRAQELAARRQAQLEQLRRQQQARAQVAVPGGVVIVRGPQPPGAPARGPVVTRRLPAQPVPTGILVPPRKSSTRPAPTSRPAASQRPTLAAPSAPPAPRPAESAAEIGSHAASRPEHALRNTQSVRGLLLGASDDAARTRGLRALIGAIEVLGPPVALRRSDRLI